MTIKQKLFLGFSGILLLAGLIAQISRSSNLSFHQDMFQFIRIYFMEVDYATSMLLALEESQKAAQKLLGEKYKAILQNGNEEKNEESKGKTKKDIQDKLNAFEHYLLLSRKKAETQITKSINHEKSSQKEEWLSQLEKEFYQYKNLMQRFIVLVNSNVHDADNFLKEVLEPNFQNEILPLIEEYNKYTHDKIKRQFKSIETNLINSNKKISLITILTLVLSLITGILIARSITKPIKKLKEAAMEIGRGKFDTRISLKTNDELIVLANVLKTMAHSLNQMTVSLKAAKEAAEIANKLKSEFITKISQNIRTPMNGVLGMMDLMLRTELTEKQRSFLKTMHVSVEIQLSLVNDIIDFSKIEEGQLKIDHSNFDLTHTVEEVVALFAERVQSKGLEIICKIHEEVFPYIYGDSNRLCQVLTNLIGNAVKFTDYGQIVIEIFMVEETKEAEMLRFEVTDTGIGIPPENQQHIFKMFSQANDSISAKFGGTGLGLAITSQIVKLMEGEIGVKSTLGRGATFWFTARFKKQTTQVHSITEKNSELHGMRVLIVDNNTSRHFLQQQVISWGMYNEIASNALQAIEMLRSSAQRGQHYNLAIVDMDMPGMDGLELAQAIKADPLIADVRLVMLTSLDERYDERKLEEEGIFVHLPKPIRRSKLYNCLLSVFKMSGSISSSEKFNQSPKDNIVEPLSCHVLLVGDNLINQEVFREMLECLGCNVDIAINGKVGVEAFSNNHYDLVFMDCQMSEMDGFEATQRIRAMEASEKEKKGEIPIIAIIVHAMKGDREKCLTMGMNDCLSKPFTIEQLKCILEQWLPKSKLTTDESNAMVLSEQKFSTEVDSEKKVEKKEITHSPIDFKVLNNIKELQKKGGSNILNKVIQVYLDNAPNLLKDLRQAVNEDNPSNIKAYAHSLKSSSGNVGARKLYGLCQEIEVIEHSDEREKVFSLMCRLEEEYDAVQKALKDLQSESCSNE